MSANIKIQIDLNSGSLLIDAPQEALTDIFQQLEVFLPCLTNAQSAFQQDNSPENGEEEKAQHEHVPTEPQKTQQKPTPAKKNSKKIESYRVTDLGLDEGKRDSLREFYRNKKPGNQKEQLLVIMNWLSDQANISEVSKEDVFTGLKIVDEIIPARISSVMSNLQIDGYIFPAGGGKYTLHHTGEDYVKRKLPKESKK